MVKNKNTTTNINKNRVQVRWMNTFLNILQLVLLFGPPALFVLFLTINTSSISNVRLVGSTHYVAYTGNSATSVGTTEPYIPVFDSTYAWVDADPKSTKFGRITIGQIQTLDSIDAEGNESWANSDIVFDSDKHNNHEEQVIDYQEVAIEPDTKEPISEDPTSDDFKNSSYFGFKIKWNDLAVGTYKISIKYGGNSKYSINSDNLNLILDIKKYPIIISGNTLVDNYFEDSSAEYFIKRNGVSVNDDEITITTKFYTKNTYNQNDEYIPSSSSQLQFDNNDKKFKWNHSTINGVYYARISVDSDVYGSTQYDVLLKLLPQNIQIIGEDEIRCGTNGNTEFDTHQSLPYRAVIYGTDIPVTNPEYEKVSISPATGAIRISPTSGVIIWEDSITVDPANPLFVYEYLFMFKVSAEGFADTLHLVKFYPNWQQP